mmetsp:Transcript_40296/g.127556  ORF Transcript_40296/g.127556 Transcript_40296/m.127556 type:complete len:229 (+) Transcript_40296:259-945(+)
MGFEREPTIEMLTEVFARCSAVSLGSTRNFVLVYAFLQVTGTTTSRACYGRAFRHVHKFAVQIALRLFPMITLRRSRLGPQRPRPLGALGTELCLQGRELAFAGRLEAVARHEVGGLEGSQALGEDLTQQLRAHRRGRRTPLRGGCTSGAAPEIQLEARKGRLRGLRSARLASIHAVELLTEVQRQQPSLATAPAGVQEQVIPVVLDIVVIDDVMLLLILHQLLHGLK